MTLSMDMMNRFAGLKKFVTVPLDIYLCITAVLKKYQTCLLISERDTEFVFDGKSLLGAWGRIKTSGYLSLFPSYLGDSAKFSTRQVANVICTDKS